MLNDTCMLSVDWKFQPPKIRPITFSALFGDTVSVHYYCLMHLIIAQTDHSFY